MGDYKDLIVYQKAYHLAMDIFEESKKFPPEEKFSLTNQIRNHHGRFSLILEKPIEKEDMKPILFQNFQIPKQKTLKRKFG